MEELIAIRRRSRVRRAGLDLGSVHRSRVLDMVERDAAPVDALEGIGISPAEAAPRPGDPSVARLPYLDALLVSAGDSEQAGQVRERLEDEYIVVPDLPLTLLGAAAPVGHVAEWPGWPPESAVTAAHAAGARGAGTAILVLDTGVDADHAEFAGRPLPFAYVPADAAPAREARGFDTDGHGTHVCGIIAGQSLGVAPEARLFVASVIESETVAGSLRRIVRALEWFLTKLEHAEGKDAPAICNLSLGFQRDWLRQADAHRAAAGVRTLLRTLLEDYDVITVAAVGNDGPGSSRAPAFFGEVISVGAVDSSGAPWPDSGGGPGPAPFDLVVTPKLVGYGVGVRSCVPRDAAGLSSYAARTGTSVAAPYVTGIAALLAGVTGLSGKRLISCLHEGAFRLPYPPERVGSGLARWATQSP